MCHSTISLNFNNFQRLFFNFFKKSVFEYF
ncbi:MAG: hypothetical protein ACFFA0_12235 [Promethearchaeota archaeon]